MGLRSQLIAVPALVALAAACQGGVASGADTIGPAAEFARLDGARFVWLEAECSDGSLDLARLGFERELTLGVGKGTLRLTFDTELATEGCASTAVWLAKPAEHSARWRFEPEAVVPWPPALKCGAEEREAVEGELRLSDDLLEVVTRRSNWCRGFDARFVFRRAEPRRLEPRAVVARYAAHFNRADADAIAQLFVETGSLVEPFSRTDDGNYRRHEGRSAVRDWYAAAFTSTPWLALQLRAIEPGREAGQVVASWEYMDARLASPLHGRNLFVIAGGEIYETEVQLIDDPSPAPAGPEPKAAATGPQPKTNTAHERTPQPGQEATSGRARGAVAGR